jgi:beta-glucosidase
MKRILKTGFILLLLIILSGRNIGQNTFPSTDERKIDSLIALMTVDEKIGQLSLFAAGWDVTGPAMNDNCRKYIPEGKAGAILNAYTVDYVKELQRMAVEESRLKIPLLFGYDVIHGFRTIFPIPLGQACSWDMDLIRQSDRIAATEATAEGINWTFAPMVDLARDPRWGRVAEGAGEDTWLACKIAAARVNGFQGDDLKASNTLLACAKHFAAYGAAQAGRDYGTVDISPVTLYENYLPPYKACVDAGAGSVMTSFNEINGVPSTGNRWLLTDLLRHDWKFEGFVVTDWTSLNEMVNHGVASNIGEASNLAMNAGVDMDMMGSAYLDALKGSLGKGQITIQQLDQAVRNILKAKFRLGLFDDPYRYCNKEREKEEILTPADRAFARKMVAECCVLLKNEKQTLPIPSEVRKIAIIGPLGNSKQDMLGTWSATGKAEDCISLLEGVRNMAGKQVQVTYSRGCNVNDNDRSGIEKAVKNAKSADFVLLAIGEEEWMSGEAASRSIIGLPGVQEELAEAVILTGKPVAVVLFNGRPLAIPKLSKIAPAILETWFGGTEAGNGIADILFGNVNPSGKLTMSFPRNEGQIPIYYNGKNTGRPYDAARPDEKYVSRYIDVPNTPLYPFGFGLSYTTFSYSKLSVEVKGDSIIANVSVTNTGGRDGTETVQLYVQDKVGSITRPVKELKGFRKVMIRAGETKALTIALRKEDLAFYHPDLRKYFESGEFIVYVGTNSEENLSGTIPID